MGGFNVPGGSSRRMPGEPSDFKRDDFESQRDRNRRGVTLPEKIASATSLVARLDSELVALQKELEPLAAAEKDQAERLSAAETGFEAAKGKTEQAVYAICEKHIDFLGEEARRTGRPADMALSDEDIANLGQNRDSAYRVYENLKTKLSTVGRAIDVKDRELAALRTLRREIEEADSEIKNRPGLSDAERLEQEKLEIVVFRQDKNVDPNLPQVSTYAELAALLAEPIKNAEADLGKLEDEEKAAQNAKDAIKDGMSGDLWPKFSRASRELQEARTSAERAKTLADAKRADIKTKSGEYDAATDKLLGFQEELAVLDDRLRRQTEAEEQAAIGQEEEQKGRREMAARHRAIAAKTWALEHPVLDEAAWTSDTAMMLRLDPVRAELQRLGIDAGVTGVRYEVPVGFGQGGKSQSKEVLTAKCGTYHEALNCRAAVVHRLGEEKANEMTARSDFIPADGGAAMREEARSGIAVRLEPWVELELSDVSSGQWGLGRMQGLRQVLDDVSAEVQPDDYPIERAESLSPADAGQLLASAQERFIAAEEKIRVFQPVDTIFAQSEFPKNIRNECIAAANAWRASVNGRDRGLLKILEDEFRAFQKRNPNDPNGAKLEDFVNYLDIILGQDQIRENKSGKGGDQPAKILDPGRALLRELLHAFDVRYQTIQAVKEKGQTTEMKTKKLKDQEKELRTQMGIPEEKKKGGGGGGGPKPKDIKLPAGFPDALYERNLAMAEVFAQVLETERAFYEEMQRHVRGGATPEANQNFAGEFAARIILPQFLAIRQKMAEDPEATELDKTKTEILWEWNREKPVQTLIELAKDYRYPGARNLWDKLAEKLDKEAKTRIDKKTPGWARVFK